MMRGVNVSPAGPPEDSPKALERDRLETEVQKGIESGPPIPVGEDYWKRFRNRLASERTLRRSKGA
jgi:hypothetical protein